MVLGMSRSQIAKKAFKILLLLFYDFYCFLAVLTTRFEFVAQSCGNPKEVVIKKPRIENENPDSFLARGEHRRPETENSEKSKKNLRHPTRPNGRNAKRERVNMGTMPP
jgi:hypothetical protein